VQTPHALKCDPSTEVVAALAEMGSWFELAAMGEFDAIEEIGSCIDDALRQPIEAGDHPADTQVAVWVAAAKATVAAISKTPRPVSPAVRSPTERSATPHDRLGSSQATTHSATPLQCGNHLHNVTDRLGGGGTVKR
jgi:hypothetical protein